MSETVGEAIVIDWCHKWGVPIVGAHDGLIDAIDAALAAARTEAAEARAQLGAAHATCAKIAEDHANYTTAAAKGFGYGGWQVAATTIADAIRAAAPVPAPGRPQGDLSRPLETRINSGKTQDSTDSAAAPAPPLP